MDIRTTRSALALLLGSLAFAAAGCTQTDNAAATKGRYDVLNQWPDFGGNWNPEGGGGPGDPRARVDVSLKPDAEAELKRQQAESAAGRPPAFRASCLPRSGFSFWSGLNEKEIVMTPHFMLVWNGRGNESLRRIYIDGRQHSPDPDPSFTGESVGHWENGTLVVDTIAFRDDVFAYSQGDGAVANGGKMHMVERYALVEPDTLQVDIEIDAPNAYNAPIKFTRRLTRDEAGQNDFKMEYVCAENDPYYTTEGGFQSLNTNPPADAYLPPGQKP